MSLELYVLIAAVTCFVFNLIAWLEDPELAQQGMLGIIIMSAGWPVGIPMVAAIYFATFVKHIADRKTKDSQ